VIYVKAQLFNYMGRAALRAVGIIAAAIAVARCGTTPFILNNEVSVSNHDASIPASNTFSGELQTFGAPMIGSLYAFIVFVVFTISPRYNTNATERAVLLIGVVVTAQVASLIQYLQCTTSGKHNLPGFSTLSVHWTNLALVLILNTTAGCLVLAERM